MTHMYVYMWHTQTQLLWAYIFSFKLFHIFTIIFKSLSNNSQTWVIYRSASVYCVFSLLELFIRNQNIYDILNTLHKNSVEPEAHYLFCCVYFLKSLNPFLCLAVKVRVWAFRFLLRVEQEGDFQLLNNNHFYISVFELEQYGLKFQIFLVHVLI